MKFHYVHNLWDDGEARKLSGVDRLVYRSNKLGADQRITNTGGGNTSSKIMERDPLTGEEVEVLWVKGSGGDLRTIQEGKFFIALPVQIARPAKDLRSPKRQRPQVAGRG